MKKGVVKFTFISMTIIIFLIFIFSTISYNSPFNKKELIDFSEIYYVDNVVSANYKSNFDITLKKNNYKIGDCVYVIREKTTSIYAKYHLTKEDVEILSKQDLNLYLSGIGKLDTFYYHYVIVNKQDVKRFEKLFNTVYSTGKVRELYVGPMISEIKMTSSLADGVLTEDEYDNNDEKIYLYLMQSQKYKENATIKIVDYKGRVLLERALTSSEISKLQRDNLNIKVEASDFVNSIENNFAQHDFFVKIVNGDDLIQAYFFSIIVSQTEVA